MKNWAGNYEYKSNRIHLPETVDEIRSIVERASRIRALGSRHSFNAIADCEGGELISTEHFNKIVSIDRDLSRPTVTIEGGMKYGELCPILHREGFALHNLASLPHISVAGAVATGTHGSGVKNQNLAAAVTAIEFVDGNGELRQLSRARDGDIFNGVVVSLAAIGIVTQLALDLQPAFEIQQFVYENLPLQTLYNNFDSITSAAYSVSLFTNWQTDRINQIWFKCRDGEADALASLPALRDATPAPADRHPLAHMSAENCSKQMGVAGPWHERLPHFRMEFTPSAGEELQSEYFVEAKNGVAAIEALSKLRNKIAPLLQISEIRCIAADEFWMSPHYQRQSVGLHFTWKQDWPGVRALLPEIEAAISDFKPIPHWGKLFTLSAESVRERYPQIDDFRNLIHEFDRDRKFRNAFIDEVL